MHDPPLVSINVYLIKITHEVEDLRPIQVLRPFLLTVRYLGTGVVWVNEKWHLTIPLA